jgi:hypothetical protein
VKKIIFFLLFLVFTRVGFAAGLSPSPVGIGNFFLGPTKITDSNFNQVLGLLVGPSGTPGVAGVSGANGKDGAPGSPGIAGLPGISGINGVNGINGRDGNSGAVGLQGPSGPPGPPGPAGASGTANYVGLGGGSVALDTCDKDVTISATQAFEGTYFSLATIVVDGILGIVGSQRGCAGQVATIHLTVLGNERSCALSLPADIAGTSNRITFTTSSCSGAFGGIRMQDLGQNIGFEITGGV